ISDLYDLIDTTTVQIKDNGRADKFARFNEYADYLPQLGHTKGLFELREKSFKQLNSYIKSDESNKYEVQMRLASYVVVSWSIYDRIANTCMSFLGYQYKPRDAKIVESIIRNEDLPELLRSPINQHYRWPILISYAIRNCIVHEGFHYEITNMLTDFFELNDDFKSQIKKKCYNLDKNKNNKPTDDCLKCDGEKCYLGESVWDKQINELLLAYHNEIDNMLCHLIKATISLYESYFKSYYGVVK
ncbi:MAG: hypothetical protein LBV04_03300, partial [Deferribacteraceae bacterium]|nr:hypothetical protein [Deferribacteraceae bacterium]